MQVARIEGATRVLGQSQGYRGLPVRDEVLDGCPCMVTAWQPSIEELELLMRGASIHVMILGAAHPPIKLEVGEPPA